MIDFDALVLNRCENIFALACKFTYAATKPEAAPYIARGIYSSSPVDVILQDETVFSDQQTSLGIRLRDFEIPPERGDIVEIIERRHPAFGKTYWIGDSDLDGQGGAMLMLRVKHPEDIPAPVPPEEEDLEEAPNDGQMYVRQNAAWVVIPPRQIATFAYRADTQSTAASDPGTGKLRWDNATQVSATALYFDRLTQDGFDIGLYLKMSGDGTQLAIQDSDFSYNNQIWRMTGPAVEMADWFAVPVEFVSQEGSSSFTNNQNISVLVR